MKKFINAGDAKAWKQCRRRVWFDHNPPSEMVPAEDAFESLIQQVGEAHEQDVLAQLSKSGEVTEAQSIAHTQELIEQKTPIIYQPVARDDELGLQGKPDFLVLRDSGEYQVVDAKLAASLKKHPDLMIQLGLYRQLFSSELPALAYLGSGSTEEVGDEANSKCEKFIEDMQQLIESPETPAALFSYSKCGNCAYQDVCVPEFEAEGNLSLLYGVESRAVPGLNKQGIDNIEALAGSDPEQITDVPYLKGVEKKRRAIWQAQAVCSGQMRVLREVQLPQGTWVHFDVETNPLSALGSEVYLWGLLQSPYDSTAFEYVWSEGGREEDYQAWMKFLEIIETYAEKYPDLVLAHFANFEVVQIKTYAARYEMEQDARVTWLLGENSPLFDMCEIVKKSLVLPLRSYGLKAICKSPSLVNFQWELEESGSQWSVVRYIDYLNESSVEQREMIKQEILSYNRDDVKATRALEVWLRKLTKLV